MAMEPGAHARHGGPARSTRTTVSRPAVSRTTERLTLRHFDQADTDLLLALDSDPEVMRYLTGGVPTSRADIEARVLPAMTHRYSCLDGPAFWAAEERASGNFVGWFHLRPKGHETPTTDAPAAGPTARVSSQGLDLELGYRLNRLSWGRGYATEGSRSLVRAAFEELGAERVHANTMAVNARSRRVMEKVGLRHIRTFFEDWPETIDGSEHGEVEYAVTREAWAPWDSRGSHVRLAAYPGDELPPNPLGPR